MDSVHTPPSTGLEEFIATIPDPHEVRERLGRNLAEAKLLRRLLRLSEDKARAAPCQEEAIGCR